jgi:hypothetical protein
MMLRHQVLKVSLFAVAACTLVLGGAAVNPAVAAQNGTVSAVVHSSVTSVPAVTARGVGLEVTPETTCPVGSGEIRVYFSGCGSYAYGICQNNTISGLGASPGDHISNGCSTHIVFYENTNATGYSLCVNPKSATGEIFSQYDSVYDTGVGGDC